MKYSIFFNVSLIFFVFSVSMNIFAETLFDAISSGELKKVKAQIEILETDTNKVNTDGTTPLVYSIKMLKGKPRIDIVTYLLEKKANPNGISSITTGNNYYNGKSYSNLSQTTPLTSAILQKDAILIRILLASGANPEMELRLSPFYSNEYEQYILSFGETYLQDPKQTATALDLAIFLLEPTIIQDLILKSPKLKSKYNLKTVLSLGINQDLAGFKQFVKTGGEPTAKEVAYLLHYGKLDFLTFLEATMIYPTSHDFVLTEDAKDIQLLADFFDSKQEELSSDPNSLFESLYSLEINWPKINYRWNNSIMGKSEDVNRGFKTLSGIVMGFSNNKLTQAQMTSQIHKVCIRKMMETGAMAISEGNNINIYYKFSEGGTLVEHGFGGERYDGSRYQIEIGKGMLTETLDKNSTYNAIKYGYNAVLLNKNGTPKLDREGKELRLMIEFIFGSIGIYIKDIGVARELIWIPADEAIIIIDKVHSRIR